MPPRLPARRRRCKTDGEAPAVQEDKGEMIKQAVVWVLLVTSAFTQVKTLDATPATVAWGYYWSEAKPVLRVKSGDTVRVHTLITNSPQRLEQSGVAPDKVEKDLRDVYDQVKDRGPGGHILTGPIYVEG